MRILHCADLHIRALSRHKEYEEQFKKLYEIIKEEKIDLTVIAGDIVHSKLNISPELVSIVGEFLKTLANMTEVHIIPGNHDGNLVNNKRLTALSPIVELLDNESIHYHEKSGVYKLNDKISFGFFSPFDEENYPKPQDLDGDIKIAVYHGPIYGSKTDIGFEFTEKIIEDGRNVSYFDGFDVVMLGDIHKRQYLHKSGSIAYCGSIIQQNYGESNEKGCLIWDIEDNNISSKFVPIDNDYEFITLEVDDDFNLPSVFTNSKYPRIRLVLPQKYITSEDENRLRLEAKQLNASEVRVIKSYVPCGTSIDVGFDNTTIQLIREESTQERLLRSYISEKYPDQDKSFEDAIIAFDKEITKDLIDVDVLRNVNWDFHEMEWDNLFCYGKENKIDFSKLNGIVGILGQNRIGKSSIVDAILYSLFNSTTRSGGPRAAAQNLHIINNKKNHGYCRVIASVGDTVHKIERITTKSSRKNRKLGVAKTIAATTVDYGEQINGNWCSRNGQDRKETDRIIRKNFGTIDDFLTTAVSDQKDSCNLIEKTPRERKDIIAKFLDIGIFDEKFSLLKDKKSEMKGKIASIPKSQLDTEQVKLDIKTLAEDASRLEREVKTLRNAIIKSQKMAGKLFDGLHDIEDLDEKKLSRGINEDLITLERQRDLSKKYITAIKSNKSYIKEYAEKLKVYESKLKTLSAKSQECDLCCVKSEKNIALIRSKIKSATKLTQNLDNIPESDCLNRGCYFIRDAQVAVEDLKVLKNNCEREEEILSSNKKIRDSIFVEKVQKEFDACLGELQEQKKWLNDNIDNLEQTKRTIEELERKISKGRDKLEQAEIYKKKIEENHEIRMKSDSLFKEAEEKIIEADDLSDEMVRKKTRLESLKNSLKFAIEQKEALRKLEYEKDILDVYSVAVSRNGISRDIITTYLPVLNKQINDVLEDIVDFTCELDPENMDIFIEDEKYGKRLIELASGFEKVVISLAIRTALIMSTSLPKPNIFIIDEGFGSLDSENLMNMKYVFDRLRRYFKQVLVITHIDTIKDIVDYSLSIEQVDGFSHVEI